MPSYIALLRAVNVGGRFVKMLGRKLLAPMSTGFDTRTLTNARIERITGLSRAWCDLRVVCTLDERWGP